MFRRIAECKAELVFVCVSVVLEALVRNTPEFLMVLIEHGSNETLFVVKEEASLLDNDVQPAKQTCINDTDGYHIETHI